MHPKPHSVQPLQRLASRGWWRRAMQLCITTALLAPSLRADAEQLNIRTYGVEDGLAQSSVSALLQDHKGYLWLGSSGAGLTRFDGHRFEKFSEAEGLPGDFVRTLVEDRSGAVWVGTTEGLARFDGARLTAFSSRDGLSHSSVWSLTVLKSGELL